MIASFVALLVVFILLCIFTAVVYCVADANVENFQDDMVFTTEDWKWPWL